MSKSDISVNTRPVAGQYENLNEKIIEFSSPAGGGLISFTITPDDQLSVHVYRQDMTVAVSAGEPGQPVRNGNLRMDRALYEAAKAYVTGWESRNTAETERPFKPGELIEYLKIRIAPGANEGQWMPGVFQRHVTGSPYHVYVKPLAEPRSDILSTRADIRRIPPELISAARAWIADCEWGDLAEDDVADLSDAQVYAGVAAHYEGGWAAFAAAGAV